VDSLAVIRWAALTRALAARQPNHGAVSRGIDCIRPDMYMAAGWIITMISFTTNCCPPAERC
jgi:hypothetical protein